MSFSLPAADRAPSRKNPSRLSRGHWKVAPAAAFLLLAGCYLAVNIATATSFAPWVDEVMQIDAGVNLALGHGWTSTAWQSQSRHEFWAGNNPIYPLAVWIWTSLLGFSPLVVRSVNYCLALAIAWLIADTSKRTGLVTTAGGQAVIAALVLCNQSVAFVARSGRADLVTLGVVVVLVRVYVLATDPLTRSRNLTLAAVPLLAAGLQAIPYVVVLLVLARLAGRPWSGRDLRSIALGTTAGGLLLAALHLWQGSLRAFVAQTFASGYNLLGATAQALILRDDAAVERWTDQLRALAPRSLIEVLARDQSSLPLIAFLVAVAIRYRSEARAAPGMAARVGLVAAGLVPVAMLAAGRYAFYYAWMAAVPLGVAFAVTLESLRSKAASTMSAIGLVAAIGSIALGLPRTIWNQVGQTPPGAYESFDLELARVVRADDFVLGDPIVYYAVKPRAARFYSLTYSGGRGYPRMSDDEREGITLILTRRTDSASAMRRVDGEWHEVTTLESAYASDLAVYRRGAEPL